jgi:hypothetical protein
MIRQVRERAGRDLKFEMLRREGARFVLGERA